LGVHYAKDEDELVEDEVPEFVLYMLQKSTHTSWLNFQQL